MATSHTDEGLASCGAIVAQTERLSAIDLHFTPTPNGQKISIALEEVGARYLLSPARSCSISRKRLVGRSAEKAIPDKYMQRRAVLAPEQWSNMFSERMGGAVQL